MDKKCDGLDSNNSVIVDTQISERDLKVKDEILLTYNLKYPQFQSDKYKEFIGKLNLYYSTRNVLFQRFDIKRLYQLAYEDYEAALKNGYPFHTYEVYRDFTVTYNKDCIISMYFNTYEYTGGAHGMTVREADTWNLLTDSKIELSDLFVYPKNYREDIINSILHQIEENIKEGNYYFEDYKQKVVENFNKRNFYLTEEGIIIYYQLYDIAPYSSGIMTFLIPYKEGKVVLPSC